VVDGSRDTSIHSEKLSSATKSYVVAAEPRLREFDRGSPLRRNPTRSTSRPESPLPRVQQLRLLAGEDQRAQALQRPHRTVARFLERFIKRAVDRFELRQARRGNRCVHRGTSARSSAKRRQVEAIDGRAGAQPQRERFFR